MTFKERTFNAIIDLICMLGFLGVTSTVKDCFLARKGEQLEDSNYEFLKNMQVQLVSRCVGTILN